MTERELQIIRYADGTMAAPERARLKAELGSDDLLRSEITLEETILTSFRADASRLELDTDLSPVPGAPLLAQLSSEATSASDNRVIYYVLTAAAILIVWLLMYVLRGNEPTPAERVAPAAPPPSAVQPAAVPQAEPLKTENTNKTSAPHPSPKKAGSNAQQPANIDLDKGLGEPKVFDDHKGHMPIKNN